MAHLDLHRCTGLIGVGVVATAIACGNSNENPPPFGIDRNGNGADADVDGGGSDAPGEGGPRAIEDEGAKGPPLYVSGTRLRARRLTTPEGRHQFFGWHDAARNESCRFDLAGDGALRCLPDDAGEMFIFSDAACNVPLVVTVPGSALPRYGTLADPNGTNVYLVGGAYTGGHYYFRPGGDGPCTLSSAGPKKYNAVGPVIAPTEFVGGIVRTDQGTQPPVPRYIAGDDGSRETTGWYDPSLSESCDFLTAADGNVRCLPGGLYADQFYADPSCKNLVAASEDITTPKFGYKVDESICPATTLMFSLSAMAQPKTLYYHSGTDCMAWPFALTAFAIGPEVPPANFAMPARVTDSTGRLRGGYYVTPAGYRVFDAWSDSALGQSCKFDRASDGQQRCLPADAVSGMITYADSACTSAPTVISPIVTSSCVDPKTITVSDDTNPPLTHAYPRGSALTPVPKFYEKSIDQTECAFPGVMADAVYYSVGPELPASTFALGVEAIQ